MVDAEIAPCALCLTVEQSNKMLKFQLPPSAGEPGLIRQLCNGCASAIEAAITDPHRSESRDQLSETPSTAAPASAAAPATESKPDASAPGRRKSKISEGGEEVAKSA